MKIWISETNTAPEGYHWSRNTSEAISVMQQADMRIDRAIRNRLLNTDDSGKMSIKEMRVNEISVSDTFEASGDCRVLRMYLEELGRTDNCTISVR